LHWYTTREGKERQRSSRDTAWSASGSGRLSTAVRPSARSVTGCVPGHVDSPHPSLCHRRLKPPHREHPYFPLYRCKRRIVVTDRHNFCDLSSSRPRQSLFCRSIAHFRPSSVRWNSTRLPKLSRVSLFDLLAPQRALYRRPEKKER